MTTTQHLVARRRPVVAGACLLLALIVSGPVESAQVAGPSAAGREALSAIQEGDLLRAMGLLEPLRGQPEASAVDLAILGAIYVEVGRPQDALEVLGPLTRLEAAEPAVLFNAGRAALAVGDEERAEGLLERSVALQPVSPAARELGLLRGRQGDPGEAYRLLRPWALAVPDDVEARAAAAASALILQRMTEVEGLLEGLPEDDPRVALLHGQLLAQRGEPVEALAVLEPFVESHPPEMEVDFVPLIGELYIQMGRAADTVALLRGRGRMSPRAALVLADALFRTGEPEEAAAALAPWAERIANGEAGDRIRPGIVTQLFLDYGRMLVAAGRQAEAIPHLQRATRMDPSNHLAWKSLGDALIGAGRRPEAMQALQRFRRFSESQVVRQQKAMAAASDPVIRTLLDAQQAVEDGRIDEALRLLRLEIGLSPGDLRPRISEVRVLLAQHRLAEAERAALAALAAFPNQADAIYLLGAVRVAQQDTDEAEAAFRRAISLMPQHVAALNDLAVILLARGDDGEARELLQRVLEIQPEDEMARSNLERLGD